jgi:predicted RecB family nuclease
MAFTENKSANAHKDKIKSMTIYINNKIYHFNPYTANVENMVSS